MSLFFRATVMDIFWENIELPLNPLIRAAGSSFLFPPCICICICCCCCIEAAVDVEEDGTVDGSIAVDGSPDDTGAWGGSAVAEDDERRDEVPPDIWRMSPSSLPPLPFPLPLPLLPLLPGAIPGRPPHTYGFWGRVNPK